MPSNISELDVTCDFVYMQESLGILLLFRRERGWRRSGDARGLNRRVSSVRIAGLTLFIRETDYGFNWRKRLGVGRGGGGGVEFASSHKKLVKTVQSDEHGVEAIIPKRSLMDNELLGLRWCSKWEKGLPACDDLFAFFAKRMPSL